jgi:hypothetical protein
MIGRFFAVVIATTAMPIALPHKDVLCDVFRVLQ